MKDDAKRYPFDIVAVGLGVSGIHQMTREAEETIRRCTETFVTDLGPGVFEHLETLAPQVTDLSHRYRLGDHRIEIYRNMASDVVAAALDHAPVCFATYGHPKMYCYPTTLLQRAARVLDLRVKVMPGVSFLDTLLADLGVDPAYDGLQVFEATDLVIRRRPLYDDVPTVIVQAPIVLDAYNRAGGPNTDDLSILEQHLREFYPAGHTVLNVVSANHPLLEPIVQQVKLSELTEALAKGSNIGTLYIPAVRHRAVADEEMAERMNLVGGGGAQPARRAGRPTIGPQAT